MLSLIAVLALPLLAVANPIVSFCSCPIYAIITDNDIFVVRQGWWPMQQRQCEMLQFRWIQVDRDELQPHRIYLRGLSVLRPADCLLRRYQGKYIILHSTWYYFADNNMQDGLIFIGCMPINISL